MHPQMESIKDVIEILGAASPVEIREQLAERHGTTVARMWTGVVLECEGLSVLKVLRKYGWTLEQLAKVKREDVQAWRAAKMAKYPTAIPRAAYHSAETVVKALLPGEAPGGSYYKHEHAAANFL